MPMEVGQPEGGLMDSVHVGNPQADDRGQVERLARVVALVQAGQGRLTRPEVNILNQIQKQRIRHQKERADWQRRATAHRAIVESLIDRLEAVRTRRPAGRFARAAMAPRITGRSRRREISRQKASRTIRR